MANVVATDVLTDWTTARLIFAITRRKSSVFQVEARFKPRAPRYRRASSLFRQRKTLPFEVSGTECVGTVLDDGYLIWNGGESESIRFCILNRPRCSSLVFGCAPIKPGDVHMRSRPCHRSGLEPVRLNATFWLSVKVSD